MTNFPDRLVAAIRTKRNPILVGIDPRADWLPRSIVERYHLEHRASPHVWARAIEEFCSRALSVVAAHVPAVKFQSAFFEQIGPDGIVSLGRLIDKARRLGLIAILDAKRGDIGTTSEAYAQAAFGRVSQTEPGTQVRSGLGADALTVNPYMGRDSLQPFLDAARSGGCGLFVLVRTSNAGAADLQEMTISAIGHSIYRQVAEWVREWSEATRGACGFGAIGAVVGGTARYQIAELRAAMPHAILLIPGYGAQGATASHIADAFDDHGLGAIVNNSRGILYPRGSYAQFDANHPWETDIELAVERMGSDLAAQTFAGKLASLACHSPANTMRG